jgi:hypothetical protein
MGAGQGSPVAADGCRTGAAVAANGCEERRGLVVGGDFDRALISARERGPPDHHRADAKLEHAVG